MRICDRRWLVAAACVVGVVARASAAAAANFTASCSGGVGSDLEHDHDHGNGATIARSTATSTSPFRFFFVGANPLIEDWVSPGAGDLTLSDLTLVGGLARGGDGDNGGGGGAGMGGAIFNVGTVAINSSTIVINVALGGSGSAANFSPSARAAVSEDPPPGTWRVVSAALPQVSAAIRELAGSAAMTTGTVVSAVHPSNR